MSQIIASCRLIFDICFIYKCVYTNLHGQLPSSLRDLIRTFYVKLAFCNELYLTQQTDFAVRSCFWFSASDCSVEQVCPPMVYNVSPFRVCYLR